MDDNGIPLGLDADFATLGSKANRDGFELFLRQRLDADLSIATAGLVKIRFEEIGGRLVCAVAVGASGNPVFVKPSDGNLPPSEFWVRVGNATKQMHGDDMVRYQEQHWG